MPNPIIDSSFPSVLVYGTLGSIISIATVWLVSFLFMRLSTRRSSGA
jgi:hypothetical protein